MRATISAEQLKREACKSKREGKATETFGALLTCLATRVAGRYDLRGAGIDPDDAVGDVLLRCLEHLDGVRCNWRARQAFNYFTTISRNAFHNIARAHFRRIDAMRRYADQSTDENDG